MNDLHFLLKLDSDQNFKPKLKPYTAVQFRCRLQLIRLSRVCVLNAAVRAVPVGSENHAPDDAVYAPWKPRVSASDRVFHFQARMYAHRCI